MAAPMDVQLDCDDKTMVQPDVMVVCDRDKITRKCIYGARGSGSGDISLILQRKKDMYVKLGKYNGGRRFGNTGMVDPKGKKVIVYDFEAEVTPSILWI